MFLRYRLCVVDSSYGVLAHTFTWFSWFHHLELGVHTITRRQNIAESAMLCHTVGVARTHARVRACNNAKGGLRAVSDCECEHIINRNLMQDIYNNK